MHAAAGTRTIDCGNRARVTMRACGGATPWRRAMVRDRRGQRRDLPADLPAKIRVQRCGTGVAVGGPTHEGVTVLDRHQPIAILFTSLLFACAAAPTAQLGETEAAYRAAQEVGAADQPDAAYHLKLAEDQIAAAKKEMNGNRKEKRHARDLLEQGGCARSRRQRHRAAVSA